MSPEKPTTKPLYESSLEKHCRNLGLQCSFAEGIVFVSSGLSRWRIYHTGRTVDKLYHDNTFQYGDVHRRTPGRKRFYEEMHLQKIPEPVGTDIFIVLSYIAKHDRNLLAKHPRRWFSEYSRRTLPSVMLSPQIPHKEKPMTSVKKRIKEIRQPNGGYLRPSSMREITLEDSHELSKEENIHASIVGMAVDYLTRLMTGSTVIEAFNVPIRGYAYRKKMWQPSIIECDKRAKVDITSLLNQIHGLDDQSIIAACKACAYDVWYRNPTDAVKYKTAEEINPDAQTIENIRIMVKRSISFWLHYGPVVKSNFTFERDGYTATVNAGDGDYMTKDTIWEFKVSAAKPTNKHTLQILMYYIMGQHSGKEEYLNITRLGIYNPRLNKVYLIPVANISAATIEEIEKNVICY